MAPQGEGKSIVHSTEYGDKMVLECLDSLFDNVVMVAVWELAHGSSHSLQCMLWILPNIRCPNGSVLSWVPRASSCWPFFGRPWSFCLWFGSSLICRRCSLCPDGCPPWCTDSLVVRWLGIRWFGLCGRCPTARTQCQRWGSDFWWSAVVGLLCPVLPWSLPVLIPSSTALLSTALSCVLFEFCQNQGSAWGWGW